MNIAVLLEQNDLSALALVSKARSIAPDSRISVLCESAEPPLERLRRCGADEAVILGRQTDDCAQAKRVARAIGRLQPDSVLFPATVRGRFLSAFAAAKLHTGLTADCTGLGIDENGLLRQTRPAFGGNLFADIVCALARPQLASVRPGVFEEKEYPLLRPFTVRQAEIPEEPERLKRSAFQPVERQISLQTAPVIVAGGKGVGGREGFDRLFELAGLLGGAVGATRSAVDAGYISYAHQIGQTGVTVRPRLYLAFGVSGLAQHTVGMSASETVIAVNTDRNAPIFSCADYGIVADWRETAEKMIRYIKERTKEP